MAPHSSTLAWKIPWTKEPGGLQSTGSLRVGHDWATSLSLSTFLHWRRKWQPTPVFLPGESQGPGSLVGCRLWGRTELNTTDVTWQQQQSKWMPILVWKWASTENTVIGTANKIALNFYKRIKCQVFIREMNVTVFHCSLQGVRIQGDRGWDGWMASPARCTWVWVSSGSWWRTGRPGVLQSTGLQKAGCDWAITTSEQVWGWMLHCAVGRKKAFLGSSHRQPEKIRQLTVAAEGMLTLPLALGEDKKEASEFVLNGASKAPPQTCWIKNSSQMVKTAIHFFLVS